MQKAITFSVIILCMLILAGFVIPVSISAPPDTRVIVDHTNDTYASPSCFDEAEMTNYLQETEFAEAQELDYEPESYCSEQAMTDEETPIFQALLKIMGIQDTKWADDDMQH
ncbi:hypothetical protein [Alteribacillus sp. HJP-4]|uniref:hypothetical protein n=1 Tax=Alteribacillus sp. HJP-4 TaxID=2775394 RepID=UPI0035CCCFA3